MEIFPPCPSSHHLLPYCKYLFCFCDKCTSMVIPSQEVSRDTTNVCPIIRFHVYRNLSHFTIHDRRPYEEIKTRSICSTIQVTDTIAKVYTRKELVFLMTLITESHVKFYITEIKQLLFHLLNVRILGTHQCGK